ncbi:PREDICTED: pinin-like, partial [Poecilia mexicana]|uniref:pinin-like n=1 Tax=Poecilia mexicana TaxID=48701 RepID=UPI00072E27B8
MDNQHFEQNGNSVDLVKENPFYPYYKESTSNTNGMEASVQADDSISGPTMKFLGSPQELGYGIKATENGAMLSEHLNVPQRYDPKDELFRLSSLRLNDTANGDFHDLVQTQKFSKPIQRNSSDIVTDDVNALFGSSNKGKDMSRSPQAVVPNPFYKTLASEADLFSRNGEDLFQVNDTQDNAPSTDDNKSFKESQASSLSSSPSISPADITHVQTFKRPPRPVPRTRRPKAEKPPAPERPPPPAYSIKLEPEVPEAHTAEPEPPKPPPKPVLKPLPKPVLPHKPKKPESKPLEPENFVFEDVLLIGQEHCVEDWPEDSPELDPDFKPSGTFKLRRESMKAKMESDGGSSEDPDGTFGYVKKKDRKLRMSLLSRRSSKDKYSDDSMEGKSNTLPSRRKTPKEFGSNDYISTGDDEDHYSLDYKKKSTKTKVSHLFRRASDASSTYNDKYSPSKDGDHKKSSKRQNTIVRRQSADSVLDEDYEDGEKGGHRQRRNSKVKIKFVPQRGFAISLEKPHDEPKGAHGYTSRKGSKDKSVEEFGAHGYTPRDNLQVEIYFSFNNNNQHKL